MLEKSEKFRIAIIYLVVNYQTFKLSYTKLLLITKLMFMNIKFQTSRNPNCNYDSLAKLKRKSRSSYYILENQKPSVLYIQKLFSEP